jgi:DNA polymerase-3 subunit alpha
MKQIFKEVPEAIKNTLEIMQKCNLVMDFSKVHLPRFPIPDNETEIGYLRKIVTESLPKRYQEVTEEVNKRLDYELDVIKGTGFASYFLIIWDLIKHAKENNIPVGPGRGSAAGSIVSFLLGITDIDPLKYDLLFERFLNPARISMPDIDMDFCYEKRSQVLEYVGKKYGESNVAQIITFGTMLARAVVRDVGRVMDFSYSEVDKIAKMIPVIVGRTITLKEALTQSPELSQVYQSDAGIKRLIDVAMQLEGLCRHASTHAAGVVISDKPLMERIPLTRGAEDETVTGFDMESLEKTGMLKMDFLGLKTLTVVDSTVKIIKRTKGIDLDIGSIPLDDKKTFTLLAEAQTIGVFQLESRGMREILRKLIPTRFEDLIAVLALYRPGPLGSGMVDDFIERKQGKKPVSYGHPKLESILKETYGIILYQEQTMQIASKLAGFSLAQADLLRKAIGKKIPEIMEEQRNLFVQGSKKNGVPEKIATQIFDLIDYFSGYGFNKSHSTAYALISYRTAYLKANYRLNLWRRCLPVNVRIPIRLSNT